MKIFNHHISKRLFLLVAMETVLLFSSTTIAAWIRFGFSWERALHYGVVPKAILITLICQMTLYYSDTYVLKGRRSLQETFFSFLQAMGLAYIILSLLYYLIPGLIIGRGIGVMSFSVLLLVLTLWRRLFDRYLTASFMRERILMVGTGEIARKLVEAIIYDPGWGMKVVGFVTADPEEIGESIVNPTVIGGIAQLHRLVNEHAIDRIVVALDEQRGTLPVREILRCKLEGVRVEEGTTLMEQLSGKISVENLRPSWIIFSDGFRKTRVTKLAKRLIDLAVSLVLLTLTWPLMGIVALAIKLDSPGPVLYRQIRVKQWSRQYTLFKFRSMKQDAETNGAQWAAENDERITRVGRIIRKLRLDELPQLYNVIVGEMSLVGPRPERPEFMRELREKIPFYDERHSVKPGLTGWAQVKFPYGNTVEDSIEKLEYDLYYIKHMSPTLDLLIIFLTIKVVLLGRGAM